MQAEASATETAPASTRTTERERVVWRLREVAVCVALTALSFLVTFGFGPADGFGGLRLTE